MANRGPRIAHVEQLARGPKPSRVEGTKGSRSHFVALAVFLVSTAFPVSAQIATGPGNVAAGRKLAVVKCAECHVVAQRPRGAWRVGNAPDFEQIANMTSMTRTALLAYLRSPHRTMPNLILSDQEANDLLAYILSLKKRQNS